MTPEDDERRRELVKQIWAEADGARSRGRLDLADMMTIAAKHGAGTDWRLALMLAGQLGRHSETERAPHLVEFLARYAAAVNPESALDPSADQPALLAGLVDVAGIRKAVGVCRVQATVKFARQLAPHIQWHLGDGVEVVLGFADEFDLVVSSPPIGMSIRARPESEGGSELAELATRFRNEYAYALIAASARRLSANGRMVFLLGEKFAWAREAERLQALLAESNIFVEAIVSSPGALGSLTNVPTNLVFFGRRQHSDLFVGRLTPGIGYDVLIANLLARRAGEDAELGRLVSPDEYAGWGAFAARETVQRAIQRSGAPQRTLGEISIGIRRVHVEDPDTFTPTPNAVYLPETGLGRAVAENPVEEGRRANRFVEATLDPELAQAGFVAAWLNTEVGKLARQMVMTGSVMGRTSVAAAGNILMAVPPMPKQVRASEVDTKLSIRALDVQRLREELWRSPVGSDAIERQLEQLGQEDDLEAWSERIPFPLASILRGYVADSDPGVQAHRLLDFFEATAEFCATLLLSGLRRDDALFAKVRPNLATSDQPGRNPLARSTFGTWTYIGQALAAAVRRAVENREERGALFEAFAIDDRSFVEALVRKRLWSVLDSMRVERNQSVHSGVEGQAARSRRLERLEVSVVRLREALGTALENVEVIQPGASRLQGGVHSYDACRRLRGPNSIFLKRLLETPQALEADGLYLIDRNFEGGGALPIVPFFKLMPAPQTEEIACYFFSSQSSDGGLVFKSYHFETAPESTITDQALTDFLGEMVAEPGD